MRSRSPLLWRLMKTAAAGGAIYLLFRESAPLRRERKAAFARDLLKRNAERALAMKTKAGPGWRPPSRTAVEGMRSTPNRGIAPSGALQAEGFRPAFERGGRAR